jgi:hypothetical protein
VSASDSPDQPFRVDPLSAKHLPSLAISNCEPDQEVLNVGI